MRVSRYVYSERVNPAMAAVKGLAKAAMASREPVAQDNPYLAVERAASQAISQALESYRKTRDQGYESWFGAMFGLR